METHDEQDEHFDTNLVASFNSCLELIEQNFQSQDSMRKLRLAELNKQSAQATEQLSQVLADIARIKAEREELEQTIANGDKQLLAHRAGLTVTHLDPSYDEALAALNEELTAKMEECRTVGKERGLYYLIAPIDWSAGVMLKDNETVPVPWDESDRFDSVNALWKLL